MLLATLCLVAAVAAYGWSGLRLASGSREEGGALRSSDWWIGTGLQGVGFLTSLIARTVLPLLLVQSAIAGALAVTALLEHLNGVRRLTRAEAAAVAAVVAGIAAVAVAVVPGPARAPGAGDLAALVALLVGSAIACSVLHHPWLLGACSGTAFGAGAIAARLLVGGTDLGEVVRFWQWTPLTWAIALCMPAGIVVGQWALTRGLARGESVAALGGDYLLATVVPSLFGLLVLGESLRPGLAFLAALGVLAALLGTHRLLVGGR